MTRRRHPQLLVLLLIVLNVFCLAVSAVAQTGVTNASDNFNRPDGPLGANWAVPIASVGNLVIVSNQVGVDEENNYCYAFWAADSFDEDQYSQITITKMGSWPGVILRADSTLDQFYLGLLVGPNDYRIYSRWDGNYYLLASGTAATWQVGDAFKMEIIGDTNSTTVILCQNGNPVLNWTTTDPTQIRTGGSPGIGIYSPSGLDLTVDNWEGGDFELPPDTQPPSAPMCPAPIVVSGTQVKLGWIASTDNVAVTGYMVERQDPGNTNFVQVGTSTATNYIDTGLASSANYSYRVQATDLSGNLSPYSHVVRATTLAGAVASDNFNRPDGSLGTNWSKPIASGYNLVVTNDQVGVDVEEYHNYAFWSANTFNDDQYSQATITTVGPWTGVILRADSAQDRFYMGFVFGANDYRIYARWDGAYYSLATGSSETWQPGDILREEVRGDNPVTITLYRNGKPVLDWMSSDPAWERTGGSPGLGIYSRTGAGLTIDNWEGGNLPTAPQITASTFSNSCPVLGFSSALRQNYDIEGTTNLANGPWVSIATNISGTGQIIQFVDTNTVTQYEHFYRVKTDF